MTAIRPLTILPHLAFVYAWIVPSWADQLLPQLLMEQFNTSPNNVDTFSLRMNFGLEKNIVLVK